jgi:hypothetical protein
VHDELAGDRERARRVGRSWDIDHAP